MKMTVREAEALVSQHNAGTCGCSWGRIEGCYQAQQFLEDVERFGKPLAKALESMYRSVMYEIGEDPQTLRDKALAAWRSITGDEALTGEGKKQ